MQVDAQTFVDGFSPGFIMGFIASLLICILSFGYWLVMRPNSVTKGKVKSKAASA
jgi:hypothetical protein